MKTYNFYLLLISSIFFISCETSNPEADLLSVSTTSIGIKKSLTSSYFDITCNSSWTASISGNWATITPTYGNGNGHISIKTTTNNTGAKRYATVTVISGSSSVNVDVVQTYY